MFQFWDSNTDVDLKLTKVASVPVSLFGRQISSFFNRNESHRHFLVLLAHNFKFSNSVSQQ